MTFLGLDETTWRFINTFAAWFGAFAGVISLFISYRTARSQSRIKLKIEVTPKNYRPSVYEGVDKGFSIAITNQNFRKVNIAEISLEAGMKKTAAVYSPFTDDNSYASPLPTELSDGQQARYYVSLKDDDSKLNDVAKMFLGKPPYSKPRCLRVRVTTSLGTTFKKRIKENERSAIIKKAEEKNPGDEAQEHTIETW